MPRRKAHQELLQGARVYLSGPMDFVASRAAEKHSGWRNRVGEFLQHFGVTVFGPWFKPDVRGLHEYGREDIKSGDQIKQRWTYKSGRQGASERSWCSKQFWETLHIDLRMVDTSDFMIDLGFPANGDFTRSFSVQALPFVGSGGIYFGKLSSATSDKVPQVKNGSFSPVIAFGIGLRIGLGKDLDYGVVKAGMSVTVQGILEGIFAWYNAYPAQLSSGSATDTQLVPAGSRQLARRGSPTLTAAAAKDPFYYMIQARVSLRSTAANSRSARRQFW